MVPNIFKFKSNNHFCQNKIFIYSNFKDIRYFIWITVSLRGVVTAKVKSNKDMKSNSNVCQWGSQKKIFSKKTCFSGVFDVLYLIWDHLFCNISF